MEPFKGTELHLFQLSHACLELSTLLWFSSIHTDFNVRLCYSIECSGKSIDSGSVLGMTLMSRLDVRQ